MADTIRETLQRRTAVEQDTGLSRSSIYSLIAEGKFPKPIRLTERSVAWRESDIQQWINDRIAASKTGAA
jgi:prophage regulatory protein